MLSRSINKLLDSLPAEWKYQKIKYQKIQG